MRLRLGAALASTIVACGSFESGDVPAGGAGDAGPDTSTAAGLDGGPNVQSDAGGDAARPPSGCALITGPFILCSDFDASPSLEQATQPAGKTWQTQKAGSGEIDLAIGDAFSPDHALDASGDGAAQFVAQVHVGVSIEKQIIHLKMKLRVRQLPTSNDVYIAGLNFSNITFGLVLHADGKLGLAQTLRQGSPQKYTPTNASTIAPNTWKSIELYVNRDPNVVQAAPQVEGIGNPIGLAANPIGSAELTIGIGYCDVDCGKPDVEYDDVVLTEE